MSNLTLRSASAAPRFHSLRTAVLPVILSAAFATHALADPSTPDLVAVSMVGPGTANLNTQSLVAINVANTGDPVATYHGEIVLSADATVDGGDYVVGAFDTAVGNGSQVLTIPADAPTGLQHWGLRIAPAAGEVDAADNAVIGTQVYVLSLDLVLADPSPIVFSVRPTDDKELVADVTVTNLGTEGSVLVFSATALTPAPWLEITPPSSFAVAGEDGNAMQLKANYKGLVPGTYSTTLRFQDWAIDSDYEDLEVKLVVGDPKFVIGDRLVGQIATPGDSDDIKFDAIKGLILTLKLAIKSGELAPVVTLIDPDGDVEQTVEFAHASHPQYKTAKLKKSGEYTLKLTDAGDATGAYALKTNRKLPKSAKPRLLNLGNPGGGTSDVEVRMLPEATLDFSVKPNAKFAGPVLLGFMNPVGGPYDIVANIQNGGNGSLRVEDVELENVGSYEIQVGGFGGDPKAKAKVHVLPVQPPVGKSKLYLP